MSNEIDWFLVKLLAFILVFVALFAFMPIMQNNNVKEITEIWKSKGIEVVTNAYIDSPSIVIELGYEEWITHIGDGPIYLSGTYFYVFNEALTIGYRFSVKIYLDSVPPWRIS